MKKYLFALFMLTLLLFTACQKSESETPSTLGTSSSETPPILMIAEGFSPTNVTISKGTTVKFINKDAKPRWPASGVHPTHLLCPGFDSLRPVEPNATYSFTFQEAKTCPMHDHLNPSLKGSITVK